MKKHLHKCPACDSPLKISRYSCPSCGLEIEGEFTGCSFCLLDDDSRLFALVFLQTEGNMKDVERLMGISYPTVKSRLARLNLALSGEAGGDMRSEAEIGAAPAKGPGPAEREDILDRLEAGEISPSEAARLLRGEAT
jgi:hypothetical protein